MAIAEYYQKLAPWLIEPIDRTNRIYLEAHRELLAIEYEHILELLIIEHKELPNEQQRLRLRQRLLRDARVRGGDVQAIREAYVNVFGGLMLEIPDWLIEKEQLLTTILCIGWTDRMVALCKAQLVEAIDYARLSSEMMPETTAELYYQLGRLYMNTTSACSLQILTTVSNYYEAALQIYTIDQYPLQHAKVLVALGNAYLHCSSELWLENMEKAMYYYKKAALIYDASAATSLIHAN